MLGFSDATVSKCRLFVNVFKYFNCINWEMLEEKAAQVALEKRHAGWAVAKKDCEGS